MDEAGIKENRITCETSEGLPIIGSIVQLGRHDLVFEVFSPAAVIQSSEALRQFKVLLGDHEAYSGRAVVKSVVHTGSKIVCSVALDQDLQVQISAADLQPGHMQELFKEHLREWQKIARVRPEYKLHIADMEDFFGELQRWLDRLELGIRSSGSERDQRRLDNEIPRELADAILPSIDALWDKFERLVDQLDPASRPVHRAYLQRRLHPLMLCSPFAHRTFTKPLGYAGDYEMVNMIARNSPEGPSLYAKVVNLSFVRQAPAEAHRNRLKFLVQRLIEETVRAAKPGQPARILSVACGPAFELQTFLRDHEISNRAELTLLDFNEQTMEFVKKIFTDLKNKFGRRTGLNYIQRSVHQLLKDSVRASSRAPAQQYDFVYCAGLFDYLTDAVCYRLISLLYEWVSPGGLLLTTNVDATLNDLRSFQHSMDFLLDWQLIYRGSNQFRALVADSITGESSVKSDETGVNLFLEIRKPRNG
jgi:extracellular factor (EF) 3-hydroxypalmitic acid methyl ester biosynthesis protein